MNSVVLPFQECVLADYLFEAKIHSYLNPTHRLADGKCCGNDSFVSCEDFCNNRFQFCFLPINFTTTDTLAQCPLGNYTVIGIDDGFVFNQPGRNIFSNPLTFTGYSWSVSKSMNITVSLRPFVSIHS